MASALSNRAVLRLALAAATILYSVAGDYSPVNSRLRMEWITAFQELLKQAPPAEVQQEIQREMVLQQNVIFQWEPYFVNTQSWKNFVAPPQTRQ